MMMRRLRFLWTLSTVFTYVGFNVLGCRADILGTNCEDGKGVEVYSCYPITAAQVARRGGIASDLRVRQKETENTFVREGLNTRV